MLESDFDKEQDNSLSDDDDNDIQSLSSESNDKTQAPHQRDVMHMTILLEYLVIINFMLVSYLLV